MVIRIVVVDGHTLNPGDLSWDALRKLGEVTVYERTAAEMIVERAATAGAILTNKVAFRAGTLARLEDLRYIGVTATGVDIVDLKAARARGVTVANVPAYGTNSVAQLTIALLLELCHRTGLHSDAVRGGAWSESRDWSFTLSPQIELAGKTMGVIGFGRIGRRVGEIASAMGMRILGFSPTRKEPPFDAAFEWATIDELLMASDVVSLHCPLTHQTSGFMDGGRLAMMKPSAYLLNTARGALIDDQALADALNCGRLAGAGLDALAEEPPPAGNPLFTAKNCILTPHMAWATKESRARCMRTSVENLAAFLGGLPQNVVSG